MKINRHLKNDLQIQKGNMSYTYSLIFQTDFVTVKVQFGRA